MSEQTLGKVALSMLMPVWPENDATPSSLHCGEIRLREQHRGGRSIEMVRSNTSGRRSPLVLYYG